MKDVMNLKDLWIGDLVMINPLGLHGKFDGTTKDGKAIIMANGKKHLVEAKDLSPYTEAQKPIEITFNDSVATKTSSNHIKQYKKEIDLHIEKLNPDFVNSKSETVVDYQIRMAQDFIQQSISHKIYKITIIHGKGEGRLREYIHQLLNSYKEVKMKFPVNQDGATEVWFEY